MSSNRFGVDIGTTYYTLASSDGSIVEQGKHGGEIPQLIGRIIGSLPLDATLAFTGKGLSSLSEESLEEIIPESVAIVRAIRAMEFGDSSLRIIDVGASSLTMYSISDGVVNDIATNTLCAAGTGLFLEEQAERLGFDLTQTTALAIDDPPVVASRCTVFAKSDLIHHQQEGRNKIELWAGLCRALARSAVSTLFKGADPVGPIVFVGGVSRNLEVLRWLRSDNPEAEWIIPENSFGITAIGAATMRGESIEQLKRRTISVQKESSKMPELILKKSTFPEFPPVEVDEFGTEVRVNGTLPELFSVSLGMDIGSTSTKIAAIDVSTGEPLFDLYRKTAGDPVGSSKTLFKSMYKVVGDRKMAVVAFGTTGSGRKIVGHIFGADSIINEITAHGTATGHYHPEVETIFEIGGQDAKYIRLEQGMVRDVNMNYVCAAGTGSFIEEQARKLDIPLFDIGDVTEGIAPPRTSDRCTVFMEQDLRSLLKQGYQKEEALSSVLFSIVQNYLTRVVGNRKISKDKIFFQGATARNRGLVAAFENLLDVEVVVSPYCHIMGGIGAALLALEDIEERETSFIGRKAQDLSVETTASVCKLCNNLCRITNVTRDDGKQFSWGYMCGREPEEQVRKELPGVVAYRQRDAIKREMNRQPVVKKDEKPQTIYMPNALGAFSLFPLWREFFAELGARLLLSSSYSTPSVKELSRSYSTADSCFPMKLSIGHTADVLEKGFPVFQPAYIAEEDKTSTAISYYCPYVQSSPAVIRSALRRNNIDTNPLLAPVIDLRLPDKRNGEALYDVLKEIFPHSKKVMTKAFSQALSTYRTFEKRVQEAGEKLIKTIPSSKTPLFVLLGRPYNIYDRGINLNIPETIAQMGYHVLPVDMLDLALEDLEKTDYHNLYWYYGQRIIAAMRRIRKLDHVYPIYLTNFNCGPDSFILNYAERESTGKPYLALELDEHDSDGGYRTRLEAFIDVVKQYEKHNLGRGLSALPTRYPVTKKPDLNNATIWVPSMHQAGTPLFAAAFRGFGFDAKPLPLEDTVSLNRGKKELRGAECMPMALTLGSFLDNVEDKKGRHILFMPTAEGPCRFGQYSLLDNYIGEHQSGPELELLSPSSVNSYQGLPEDLRRYFMHTMLCADITLKLANKVRPYEKSKGDTDTVFDESLEQLVAVLEKKQDPRDTLGKIHDRFASIGRYSGKKPLVGIVGEIYVRCNPFANDNLIKAIEEGGGEAWLSPMHEWILYTEYIQNFMAKKQGFKLFGTGASLVRNLWFFAIEKRYYNQVKGLLHDRHEPDIEAVINTGREYLPIEF
ncbi:hypothetical protein KAH37_08685, partial [bacterium]|nr:hypothetical protein [bacterium]